ncbi:MAG: YihA family ribosome biogenesis GTP-binding protein, partial [Oscillospiraceae bacterium]|nr:YihA family ribosome biogenesis GTP-binding protein [Oscillospiraceae bacterium]
MNWNLAAFTAAYGLSAQLPACSAPEIAFAGRSNVGKSTLINKLFNRKNLARVSSVPGKTATINFYRCGGVDFVDLPGYGFAKTGRSELRRWTELINGYLQQERDIRAVLLLIDMRHPPTKNDLQMVDFLIDTEMPFAVVLTKADKLNRA